MKILINIRNIKIIEKEKIYTGNVNTYIINVEYEDYNFFSEYNCYLTFKNNDLKKKVIIGPDLKVIIPFDVLSETGNLIIGFFAIKVDEKEKLIRYSSEIEVLPVEKGGFDEEASEPEELTPTILEKYLQEMKNFYNESLEEFNRNATNKTEEFNKNYEDKIKSYNDNSIQKTNEYNKNADEKIKEINNKVSDIEKIEDNIEQIQKNVQASEQNAKDSEISAQNSAKKSSESESNIISIEKNINDLKKDIDNTKTQIDEKAKEVKNNSDIAIEQAKLATQQATLSGQNANKTSADKEDISQMKVSIEASEDNIEEIEKKVQAIKDDIEAAKNETLEAKEEVENSLENERIISDKKYARALKTQVEDIEQIQVYAENDEVENLTMKGAPLTQKTREGYNQLKNTGVSRNHNGIDFIVNSDGTVLANGTATGGTSGSSISQINIHDEEIQFEAGDYTIQDCKAYVVYEDDSYEWFDGLTKATSKTFDKSFKITDVYIQVNPEITVNNKLYYPMITKGTENKEYEQYGASPSLDYPSEVEITKEQKISIFRKNILDTSKLTKDGTNLAVSFEPKSDGGIKIYGTANNTWVSFGKQTLNVPIKQGTTIYSNYGKTEELMIDNNDIRPFFWFYDKDDKIMNANLYGSDFKVLPKDVYSIQFGIEHFNNGTTYDEDMYIELEISDKRPTQFQKYEVTDLSIALENGFNGALKNYYNEIKKLDGKWFLLNKFAHYVLDGTSSGKKVTAKQSKNNIDKYDVLLGTDKIYIDVSKDYWKPNLGICNYLKNDKAYGSIVDENNTNYNRITFWKSGQDQMSFSTEKDRFASIDEANAYLKQLYDAGKPLEFYVLMSEDNYETIELPEDIQKELNKFKLYDDLNNVFIDKGSLSFKYNKSLLRAFEEQSELSASLLERIQALEQAQVNPVGGN